MSSEANVSSGSPSLPDLLGAVRAWQEGGEADRDAPTLPLTRLGGEHGVLVQELIGALLEDATRQGAGADGGTTDDWRTELLACRARTWASPAAAGLLVGPTVLILTDGRRGVAVRAGSLRRLPGGTSASLLLLCQTIVMADGAVDAQELGKLRQQRIESTSTSLSEIKPVS
ncbi:hypothetical protein V3W47_04330 [Deinococcus sp. YIM 134068]|uniref:hypothetical protein n=1 Tax=Deinococcus lichenicola TaxID=3118910 RepID=UPI002F953DBF